jgi:hypothetical protein
MRVELVGKLGDRASAEVAKGQWPVRRVQMVWQPFGIDLRLNRDPRQRKAHLLGFQHTDRLAVDEEQVVCSTVPWLQCDFAHRHAAASVEVDCVCVLHDPAGLFELPIDFKTCFLLWCQLGGGAHGHCPLAEGSGCVDDSPPLLSHPTSRLRSQRHRPPTFAAPASLPWRAS